MRAAFVLAALTLVLAAGCAAPGSTPASSAAASSTSLSATAVPANEVQAIADGHHGERFDPSERTVAVGATLTFRVVGSTPHTVDFGDSNTANVDGLSASHSGNLNDGQTFAVTFTKAGTYPFHCQYHIPGMTGTITATAQ